MKQCSLLPSRTCLIPNTNKNPTSLPRKGMNSAQSSNEIKGLSIKNLPKEILIIIFSFLEPRSLLSVQCTCKFWNRLLSDDLSWRTAFFHHFEANEFHEFSPLGNGTWRQEYLLRSAITRAYERGKGQTVQYDCRIGDLTDLYYDFLSGRLFAGNRLTGSISVSDPNTGKVERSLLHASLDGSLIHTLTIMNLNKQIFGFGFVDGRVGAIIMTRQAENGRQFRFFMDSHNDAITCMDVYSGDLPPVGEVGMVTGADDGSVNCWDVRTGVCLRNFKFATSQIISICYRPRFKFLIIDTFNYATGTYMLYLINGPLQSVKVRPILFACRKRVLNDAEEPPCLLAVDEPANHVFVSLGAPKNSLLRFSFNNVKSFDFDPSMVESFVIPLQGNPVCLRLDTNARVVNKSIPGNNARLLAIGDDNGNAYIVNTRFKEFRHPILKAFPVFLGFPISDLFINEAVMVVGSSTGFSAIYDVISGNLLRNLSGARNPARRNPARCIVLDSNPLSLKGVISLGKHVKAWSYVISKLHINRRSRIVAPSKPLIAWDSPSRVGEYTKNEVDREIMLGLNQIAEERQEKQERLETQRKLARHLNEGLADLSEEEMLAYATMLSQEEEMRRKQETAAEEEDLLKNAVTEPATPLPSSSEAGPSEAVTQDYSISELTEEEQIELAMRLSLDNS
ncbi:F-box protein Pof10 [Schizosaccharomyces cryophilus OY26]|uniref:F-box protein Pof10 n=1 Tax=Schizosaccharomyces cryophilus (strain OY26 / ATCC MYA-4695 / CBS 11777 / NBRC 106824 / NRRL Y48691) TaxID=653667 RepID=S9X9B0_SCHCR|nr:F-box protein Pof10 [Schizosaccharomyces cryophilus OY26]EPY53792.1 F-box protein Pof10 [Schizosaccharomyces cryophilus OY26]